MRNKVTQNLRQSKASFFIKVIGNANGNGKLIWQNLNKLIGLQSNKNINKDMELEGNRIIIKGPLSIASSFNIFFRDFLREITQYFTPSACLEISLTLISQCSGSLKYQITK